MSELKAYLCIEAKTIEQKDFLCYRFTSATKSAPEACMEEVYLKSEADEVIEEMKRKLDESRYTIALLRKDKSHQKYKRCLAMAEMCNARYDEEDAKVNGCGASWEYISKEMKYWERWRWRWDALAEKFK